MKPRFVIALNSKQQGIVVGRQLACSIMANDYKEPQVMCIYPNGTKGLRLHREMERKLGDGKKN